jgi:sporulation integral membrane protein YlbJ
MWPQAVASGVSRGLSICSSVIIPALFPFLVLAGFLVRSGISMAVGRRMEGVTRCLFGLPGCCAAGILIGFVGGYPSGGIAVGELMRQGQITQDEGRRMLRFCVNGGPAFIISAVGANLMGNVQYGVMLFSAHIAASVFMGVGGRLFEKTPSASLRKAAPSLQNKLTAKPIPATAAFVESVNGACRSLLYMCGFVVLFAALLSLSDGVGLTNMIHRFLAGTAQVSAASSPLTCLFPCLMEVSCGVVEAVNLGATTPLILGMALGWGGLSVHCQLAATLHEFRIMGKGFFISRVIHAFLGGILTVIVFRLVPVPITAFSPLEEAVVTPYTTSAAASAALLVMCAMLLLVTGKARSKKLLDL